MTEDQPASNHTTQIMYPCGHNIFLAMKDIEDFPAHYASCPVCYPSPLPENQPRDSRTTKRDKFWRGAPPAASGFAALDRDGNIMLSSVHKLRGDVRLHCGECVPIRVEVTYVEDNGASDE